MQLPDFLKFQSPYKVQAMKLLHQFIMKKPIDNEERIAIFFSVDATMHIDPDYDEEYESFLRFHKRQLNHIEFGIGTNASQYKHQKEKRKLQQGTQGSQRDCLTPRSYLYKHKDGSKSPLNSSFSLENASRDEVIARKKRLSSGRKQLSKSQLSSRVSASLIKDQSCASIDDKAEQGIHYNAQQYSMGKQILIEQMAARDWMDELKAANP
mmetsp:Transcript_37568/g.57549  ORF Transcript_37568/g.57549 Transcript_37568/m.57549 type:complete len:210 (-) Transcript_37568:959-1588(-)